MSEVFRLQGTIDINTDKATAALKNTSEQGKQAESSMNSIGNGIQKVGLVMTAAGAGITAVMGKIINTSKTWGAEVAQQEFLYNNLDDSIQRFINTGSKQASSLSMTEQQYKNNATALANTLDLLGVSSDVISNNGEQWMNLCADMGAFADVPIDVALGDMKSALVGNFNALDKYGMSVNVATINTGDYAKELGKTWDQMTNAEKAQAIMSEAMKQSANYTGLAKEEAGEFGMKWNECKQKMMESAAAIGEKLLPVLVPMVEKIGEIATKIATWANEHPKLTQGILLVVGGLGLLMTIVGPLLMFIGTLITVIPAIIALGAPVIGMIAGISAGIMLLVGAGIALVLNWDNLKAKASEIWNNICTTIGNLVNSIKTAVSNDFNQLKADCSRIWNDLKTATSTVWNNIKTAVSNVANAVKTNVANDFNQLKTNVSNIWNGLKTLTNNVWNNIKASVNAVVTGMKSSVSNTFNSLKSSVTSVWNGIKSAISNPINAAKSAVSTAMSAIKRAINVNLKPNLKLPHISVSGKLSINPPSVPKISVAWYRKGGIMTRPTMFGLSGNTAHVGGEAGDEAILPLSHFYDYLDKKFEEKQKNLTIINNFNFDNVEIKDDRSIRDLAEDLVDEIAFIIKRKSLL